MKQQASLGQKQTQSMVLTPQLRQRIEMLAQPLQELELTINHELNQNPVLTTDGDGEELDDVSSYSDADSASSLTSSANGLDSALDQNWQNGQNGQIGQIDQTGMHDASVNGGGETASIGGDTTTSPVEGSHDSDYESRESEIGERDSFEEIDYGQMFEQYLDPGYRTHEHEVKEGPTYETFLSSEESLSDYLNWQLRMTVISLEVRSAAECIIGCLNEDGFLDATIEEIALIGPWPIEIVNESLEIVRRFDPIGIAAFDLQDSLHIQLKHNGYGNSLAAKLVLNHFSKLLNHKLPELAKELGVTLDYLVAEMKVIRQLDPRPGRRFARKEAQYIAPEVYIEKFDDDYIIRFDDDGLPQLRINKQYRQMMDNKETSREIRDYIKDRFRSAVDLLKNIEHRKQTIYKVCERIVERQRDFLDKGYEHLRPMMLKDISEDIGMHLSTVSRVVNGKYAHTPQGVIELRRFFTEGMVNDSGEDVSTHRIKLRIKKMIEAEDSRNPLTDDKIAEILANDGQKLSRRTVAKYRDQLKIAGSRERKQII